MLDIQLDSSGSIYSLDNKRYLARLLKEQKRRLGLSNLHFLCKEILGYHDLTDEDKFHGDYCRHMESKRRFKLTLTPRGSLKSSIGTIGHSIQEVIKNPNIRILIASQGFTISTKFLAEIKGHFEKNEEFISLYGNLVGKDKWSESEIIVRTRTNWKKEPTISCAGIDVTKTGLHYDRIKVDDPQDEKNTSSHEQIEKVIRWYKLLLSLLDPHGYIDITGTIWHYADLYNYIINLERLRLEKGRKPRFKIFQRDSFKGTTEDLLNGDVPPENLLWPERLSAEYLADQYIEQGPYIFSCQYRLNPIDDENATFKRSWLKTCAIDEIPTNLNIYSTVDPMRDEDGKDYLSIVTCGVSTDWKTYLLDVKRLKADEHDTVDELYNVYRSFKPIKMGFETIAFQETYMKYIQMLQLMNGIRLPIVQLKTSTRVTKRMRIKSMVPYWKAGLYIIPTDKGLESLENPGMAALVDELTRFPKTDNDDCIDALAYMNQLTKVPSVITILKKHPPNSFAVIREKAIHNKDKKNILGQFNVRHRASGKLYAKA